MPERFSRGLRLLIGIAAAAIALWAIKQLSDIVGPAFLALTLTIAVSPLRSWLVRRNAPSWVVAVAPLLVILTVLTGLGAALIVSVARFSALIPTYAAEFQNLLNTIGQQLSAAGITQAQVQSVLSTFDPAKLLPAVQALLGGAAGLASAALVVVLLLYGMSLDAAFTQRAFRRLRASRAELVTALTEFARGTCRYLVVSTVFGLIVAVLDSAALAILSVPLPLLWGLLAFITNYIPNVGFIIGLVPPALLALLDSGPVTMVWVIVIYGVANFVIQSLIQPKFVGESAGLSTTITILSLLVWTWALGALGAILAVPLSALVRAVLIDADQKTAWAGPFVAGRDSQRP